MPVLCCVGRRRVRRSSAKEPSGGGLRQAAPDEEALVCASSDAFRRFVKMMQNIEVDSGDVGDVGVRSIIMTTVERLFLLLAKLLMVEL